jgi:hypothetical protein
VVVIEAGTITVSVWVSVRNRLAVFPVQALGDEDIVEELLGRIDRIAELGDRVLFV